MRLELEDIIPTYIEIVHGSCIKAFIHTQDNGDPSEPTTFPRKIASAITEKEMLERIIAFLESDLSNLKRHLKTFQPEAVR